jgi:hypothetical protein
MPRRRDPQFTTGHLCRFCGKLVPWGAILRLIRVDPGTPGFMLSESACHTGCLEKLLHPDFPFGSRIKSGMARTRPLTFHRHWNGKPVLSKAEWAPMPDDDEDIFLPLSPGGRGSGEGAKPQIRPCAMCARDIAAPDLVRLRVQRPAGPVKKPEFDEQTLPVHFECLAAVSASRLS